MKQRFHRRAIVLACAAAGLAAAPPAVRGESAWSQSLSVSMQHYQWKDDAGRRGTQSLLPFAWQLSGNPAEALGMQFMLRSGWMRSRQTNAGQTAAADSRTDTLLGGTFSYLALPGLQPFLSLNANLPSGRSRYGNGQAHMDEDVVAAPTHGEGRNLGLTAGVNVPLTDALVATAALGRTRRGSYETANLGRFDPGDNRSWSLGLGYEGDSLSARLQTAHASESETRRNGVDYYRAGAHRVTTLSLAYAWNGHWATRANLSRGRTDKNRVLAGGAPPLVEETFNSNSGVRQIDVETAYSTQHYALGAQLGWLRRDHNAWQPSDSRFLSAKQRWSLGLNGQYALDRNVRLSLAAVRIRMVQDKNPGTGGPKTRSTAWQLVAGLDWRF
jgi:hypothetical protein